MLSDIAWLDSNTTKLESGFKITIKISRIKNTDKSTIVLQFGLKSRSKEKSLCFNCYLSIKSYSTSNIIIVFCENPFLLVHKGKASELMNVQSSL